MMIGFFKEFTPKGQMKPVRKLKLIAINYLNTGFIYHFLPLIPFTLFLKFEYSRFFYVIKCLRLRNTSELSSRNFMKEVRKYYRVQTIKKCEDPAIANDIYNDHIETS